MICIEGIVNEGYKLLIINYLRMEILISRQVIWKIKNHLKTSVNRGFRVLGIRKLF